MGVFAWFCLHVWTFWGALRAFVGVFSGVWVPALAWLGLPCQFFPVSLLTKDRRGVCGGVMLRRAGVHRRSFLLSRTFSLGTKPTAWCIIVVYCSAAPFPP